MQIVREKFDCSHRRQQHDRVRCWELRSIFQLSKPAEDDETTKFLTLSSSIEENTSGALGECLRRTNTSLAKQSKTRAMMKSRESGAVNHSSAAETEKCET